MGLYDEVLCNNDLFGEHKGETYQTKSLGPVFLGDIYEITPSGRLEKLEWAFEDQSDSNAEDPNIWKRMFTGLRDDLNYHGWLMLTCFGRAKFTDGTLVAFEADPGQEPRLDPDT